MINQKTTTNLFLGSLLVLITLIDVFTNSFFNLNLTSFLPGSISLLLPLVLGTYGLYLIRNDYTGLKYLDSLNKNVNTSNFNAVLTLLIIFLIIKDTKNLFCNKTSSQSKIIEVKDLYQWFNLLPFSMNKNGVISDHLFLL